MSDRDTFISCLKADLAVIHISSVLAFIKWWLFPRGEVIRWLVWFRIVQYSRKHRVTKYTIGVLAYPIWRHYGFKYGIAVNPNVPIGKGLHIVHGGSIFVNCAYVGEYFTAYPCTMLGEEKNGIPYVEDHVTVYTGSICVGDIRLGKGCSIGANCFVSHDVMEGQTMVGVQAKAIEREV